jgi:hypothetical protein
MPEAARSAESIRAVHPPAIVTSAESRAGEPSAVEPSAVVKTIVGKGRRGGGQAE